MSNDKLVIFDTTLRDGEQSPGASMTREEKVRIAKMLEKMRVDVIEAGFAIASDGDFESVRAVAEAVKESTICSLARTNKDDIRRAAEALEPAAKKRIHTFIATSPIHMEYKLRMPPEEVLQQAISAVKLSRDYADDVEFSLEDGSRTEYDFACRIIEATIAAGASTINIPDTVGYGEPGEYADFIGRIINNVPNADKAVFSVHCHNDLGLAVANSLAAVVSGARQVECTINGLGERAGNASLEEIVMAIRTRKDLFSVDTNINAELIVPTSKLVSSVTGFPVQPNKAIVGANAFAHESGIHQDGVLKHRETYEIMLAQDVGWSDNKLVLGKHSGRAAMRARMEELGYEFKSPDHVREMFARFKALADKKHEIFDQDLQALMSDAEAAEVPKRFEFVGLEATSRTGEQPQSIISFTDGDVEHTANSAGDGPVDAAFKAIESVVKSNTDLKLYSVNAITTGTDSQGEVTVRLESATGKMVSGLGADTDIIVASVKAYFDALNHLFDDTFRSHPQYDGI